MLLVVACSSDTILAVYEVYKKSKNTKKNICKETKLIVHRNDHILRVIGI